MKNLIKTFGIIAFVAVLGLGLLTSCTDPEEPTLTVNKTGDKTTITITGLESYNGKYASGGLADAGTDDVYVALPTVIADGKVILQIRDDKGVTISIEGDGYIVLLIYETAAFKDGSGNDLPSLYEGATYPEPVKAGANTVEFTKFTSTKK